MLFEIIIGFLIGICLAIVMLDLMRLLKHED